MKFIKEFFFQNYSQTVVGRGERFAGLLDNREGG
jgi:hypothetical protein